MTGTTVFVILAASLGFRNEIASTGNISAAIGAGTAQFLIAVVIALLFSISPRFRSPRSRTKVVLWTSVILLVAGIANMANGLTRAVERAARDINAVAPKMVDSATRLEGATAGPGPLLTVRETLVGIDGKDFNRRDWDSRVAPAIRKNAIQNASLRILLSSGGVIAFRYSGRDGAFISEIKLSSEDVRRN